jgi:hypothetical protein
VKSYTSLQVAQAGGGDSYKWAIKPKEQPAAQSNVQPTAQPANAKPEAPQKTTYSISRYKM